MFHVGDLHDFRKVLKTGSEINNNKLKQLPCVISQRIEFSTSDPEVN